MAVSKHQHLLFFRFRLEKYNFLQNNVFCLLNSAFSFILSVILYLWIRIHITAASLYSTLLCLHLCTLLCISVLYATMFASLYLRFYVCISVSTLLCLHLCSLHYYVCISVLYATMSAFCSLSYYGCISVLSAFMSAYLFPSVIMAASLYSPPQQNVTEQRSTPDGD